MCAGWRFAVRQDSTRAVKATMRRSPHARHGAAPMREPVQMALRLPALARVEAAEAAMLLLAVAVVGAAEAAKLLPLLLLLLL